MSNRWKVTIEDWKVENFGESTPVFVLSGKVFGHPKIKDGEEYFTSRIIGWYPCSHKVVSSAGMTYSLGEPDKKWAALNAKTCALLKK
jgi:hypothetical protein